MNLLERLQAADLTTRHLAEYRAAKVAERAGDGPSPFKDCTMVEAIVVWWESGVRAEVLGVPASVGSAPDLVAGSASCPDCGTPTLAPSKTPGYDYCTRCGKGSIPR